MSPVVIVGGGPAGSTLGCYLSMAGIDNLIVESAIHPRRHVGESLVPSTTRVFEEIDFLETMERGGFPRKYGAAWHPTTEGEFAIEFAEYRQEGIRQNHTYHVDRSRFDLLLLKHAEHLGSTVYEGLRVKEVLFENDRACGVTTSVAGRRLDIDADFVVDASGRNTLLGRQLRLKKTDPIFNQFAVHAWFRNVNRGNDPSAGFIHIHFLEVERGWVWQIPITEEITSIGVVAERNVFRQSKQDPEGWFWKHARSTPSLDRALADAERVNDLKSEADYSYCMDRFVGDGYMLVGDAARFVDPIFSSGVSVALESAKRASEIIRHALNKGDVSARVLEPYETAMRRGVNVWYEFIRLYYRLLPMFTYFIQSRKHRLEILRLLQGEVYDREEVAVLDEMRKFVQIVETSPRLEMWRESLSEISMEDLDDLLAAAQPQEGTDRYRPT